eukprot:3932555-Rhodomonas_salina.1
MVGCWGGGKWDRALQQGGCIMLVSEPEEPRFIQCRVCYPDQSTTKAGARARSLVLPEPVIARHPAVVDDGVVSALGDEVLAQRRVAVRRREVQRGVPVVVGRVGVRAVPQAHLDHALVPVLRARGQCRVPHVVPHVRVHAPH